MDDCPAGFVPEELSLGAKATAVVVYTLISVVALVGNAVVVFLVARFRSLRKPTNLLILNLAVADLLMAILCIPFSYVTNIIVAAWPFGGLMCSLIHFAQVWAVLGTSYTLVAISFDRFLAILFPLLLALRLTNKVAVLLVGFIWLLSALIALPELLTHQIQEVLAEDNSTFFICDSNPGWDAWEGLNVSGLDRHTYGAVLFGTQYWVPLAVLIVTYSGIGAVVWRSRWAPGAAELHKGTAGARGQRGSADVPSALAKQQSERRDAALRNILMMLLVTVLFAVSWFPQNLLMNYLYVEFPSVECHPKILYIWWGCHTVAMSHSCLNPLIYATRNAKFREGFAYVFRWVPGVVYEGKELSTDRRRLATFNSTLRQRATLRAQPPGAARPTASATLATDSSNGHSHETQILISENEHD